MKIGSVFDQTSTTEFVAMLDQQLDNERLLFSYVELSTDNRPPRPDGERIIARITNVHKENPLLSRDQAGVSASINIGGLGFDFARRFTYGWAQCAVIGTLTTRGLDMNRRVIAPNAEVFTPSTETLQQLFFNPTPSHVPLGAIETFGEQGVDEVPVTLHADELVTKHFSIFGMTGSGKTNTAAKLIEELMARGHRMIVFDSHDDYQSLESFSNLFIDVDVNSQRVPLTCRVVNRNCDAVQAAVNQLSPLPSDNKPLNECVCERLIRTASIVYRNEPARRILRQQCQRVTLPLVNALSAVPWRNLIINPQVASFQVFPELRFYGDNFRDFSIILLQAFQGEFFSSAQWRCLSTNINQQGVGIRYLQNLYRAVAADQNARLETREVLQQMLNRLQAVYNDATGAGARPLDFEDFFQRVADRTNGNPQTVYRLSLTDLSSNLRKAMVYGVVTYFFRSFKFGRHRARPRDGQPANANPLLFVLEEARALIPKSSGTEDDDTSGALARRAMRELAYEGRKFSLGFGLISQKPSTVDPEVVSQSNTLHIASA